MSTLKYATLASSLRYPRAVTSSLPRLHRTRLFNTGSPTESAPVKPYYITTPIFYPNAVPHIGHLHSLVVADILARYARISNPGAGVHFVTGTDEHGLKIQQAAKAKGLEPLTFCDQLSAHFRDLTAKANISQTHFSRTTEKDHHEAVKHLWRELDAKGLIYKGAHEGWYSVSDECFYTDGQITRVTAGGQDYYVSTETGSKVEWTKEENYKFRLSAFRESLLEHFKNNPKAVYPEQFHAQVVATLTNGLEDLSVSRPRSRLSWGIPVPNDPEHTIYVWIDALTVYLSGTGYPWKTEKSAVNKVFWPPNVQVIGKDILRFHAIYFPAMLQALGLPITRQLLTHSHWTVEQRKMSKSVGNVADPLEAIEEFGLDPVRYYLARVGGRFKDDVDWSHYQLDTHFKVLMSLLGNTYQRITAKKLQARIESAGSVSAASLAESLPSSHEATPLLNALRDDDQGLAHVVGRHMDNLELADALEKIMDTLTKANIFIANTTPWAREVQADTAAQIQAVTLETLRVCSILLQPFIPDKAGELLDALGVPADERTTSCAALGRGEVGTITSGVRLFASPKTAATQ